MQGSGQDEADLVLHEHVAGAVASAGFGAAIGGELEAEGGAVEMRGLTRVAYVKLDMIGAIQRKEILLNGGGMLQHLRHSIFSMLRYRGRCLHRCRSRCGCIGAARRLSADARSRPAPAALRKCGRPPA